MAGMFCGVGDMCNMQLHSTEDSTDECLFKLAVELDLITAEDIGDVGDDMDLDVAVGASTTSGSDMAGSDVISAPAADNNPGEFPFVQKPMGNCTAGAAGLIASGPACGTYETGGKMLVGGSQTGEGLMKVNDVWAKFEDNPQAYVSFANAYNSYLRAYGDAEQPTVADMQQPVAVPAEVAAIMQKLAAGPCLLSNDELKLVYEHWDTITSGGNLTNLLNVYMRGNGKDKKSVFIACDNMLVIKFIVAEWRLDFAAVVKRFLNETWNCCFHKTLTGTNCTKSRMYGLTFCSNHKKHLALNPFTFIKNFLAK